jgi:5-methylcytosine-specific restriction endonuclease McrA
MSYSAEYKKNRAVLMEMKQPCHWCGTPWTKGFQADHLLEKDAGGDDSLHNLVSSCAPCNQRRGQLYQTRKANARVQARNKAAGLPNTSPAKTKKETEKQKENVFGLPLSTPSKHFLFYK